MQQLGAWTYQDDSKAASQRPQDAQPGDRNNFGHWLTCRCTDAGLSDGETIKVMEVYRSNLPDNRGYTLREVQATVRSR